MSENNESSNDSVRLGSGNPLIRSGVLRPSVLGSTLHTNSSGALLDGKLKEPTFNPFLKAKDDEDGDEPEAVEDCEAVPSTTQTVPDKEIVSEEKKTEPDDEETDQRPDPLTLLRKNGMERSNLFAAAKRVENTGFVFGQNVHERVIGENVKPDSSSKSETADSTSGELLFSSVIQNSSKTTETEDGNGSTDSNNATAGAAALRNESKSLTEVAREYEESRAQKRKFEEVQTFTGEENEVNIVDISCKLFAFVNSNWEERGRGSLRLNDSKTEKECSRVVFRTSGNLRLLINTKVWGGMVAERPSQKSLRLTAMDNTGKIKVFLAQARPIEINQLHKALTQRIERQKTSHPEDCYASAVDDNNDNCIESGPTKNGAASNNDKIKIATAPEESEETTIDLDASKNDDESDDQEDSAEPSPKKTVVEATETSN